MLAGVALAGRRGGGRGRWGGGSAGCLRGARCWARTAGGAGVAHSRLRRVARGSGACWAWMHGQARANSKFKVGRDRRPLPRRCPAPAGGWGPASVGPRGCAGSLLARGARGLGAGGSRSPQARAHVSPSWWRTAWEMRHELENRKFESASLHAMTLPSNTSTRMTRRFY